MPSTSASQGAVRVQARVVSGERAGLELREVDAGMLITGLGLHGGRGGLVLKPPAMRVIRDVITGILGEE